MRVLALTLFTIVLLLGFASLTTVMAQSKSICVPINADNGTVDPNQIPQSVLLNMTNRGQGQQTTIALSLCTPVVTKECDGIPFYVAFGNPKNGTCSAIFNKPLSRPTAQGSTGFIVTYGSTLSSNNNDMVQVNVVCNKEAPTRLTSLSHKFAASTPNKLGGTTFFIVAYSSAACPSAPAPPPTPGSASCRRFVHNTQLVNPAAWKPVVLNLAHGFQEPEPFAFDLCSSTNPLPDWLPPCRRHGYITRFNDTGCLPARTFDTMTQFEQVVQGVVIQYTAAVFNKLPSTNLTLNALVTVSCKKGATKLESLTGQYNIKVSEKELLYVFALGHEDLCGVAPTTRPTKPTLAPPTKPTQITRPTILPTLPTRPTPVTEPTRLTKPTAEPTKPTNETKPTPITLPTRPTEITKPTAEPTKPTNQTKPTAEPTKPTNQTKPTEITKPTNEPTRPTNETKPTAEPTRPTNQTKPTAEPTRPTNEPTRPTNETKPTGDHTKPTADPTKPTNETKPTEITKPTPEPTKPTGEHTKPTADPTKPTEGPTRETKA